MKKFTAAIAALVLCVSTFAFSPKPNSLAFDDAEKALVINKDNVSKIVTASFTSRYANAMDVIWKDHPDFYFASFTLSNQHYSAAFAKDGSLIAVSRQMASSEMPLAVTSALQENYASYTLASNAWEMVMNGETDYYITADGKSNFLSLKCATDGSISVYKKHKKKVLVGKAF